MPEPASRRIPWPRIFAEGVVIVVSILLALAADAWWDGRQQAVEESVILEGLEADLEATLDAIAAQHVVTENTVSIAVELISLGGSRSNQVSAAQMDTLLASLLPGSDFVPVDATLNALLNSDGLGSIRSPELRARLAEWPRLINTVEQTENNAQSVFNASFLPYLHERVPMRTLDALAAPERGDEPSAFSRDSRELLEDLTFENHVNDLLFYNRSELRGLSALEEHILQTLELLRSEMNGS